MLCQKSGADRTVLCDAVTSVPCTWEWEQGEEGGGPGWGALSILDLLLVEREQSILHDWSLQECVMS